MILDFADQIQNSDILGFVLYLHFNRNLYYVLLIESSFVTDICYIHNPHE